MGGRIYRCDKAGGKRVLASFIFLYIGGFIYAYLLSCLNFYQTGIPKLDWNLSIYARGLFFDNFQGAEASISTTANESSHDLNLPQIIKRLFGNHFSGH